MGSKDPLWAVIISNKILHHPNQPASPVITVFVLREFHYHLGWPGTLNVEEAGLRLGSSGLGLPNAGITGLCYHTQYILSLFVSNERDVSRVMHHLIEKLLLNNKGSVIWKMKRKDCFIVGLSPFGS